MPLTFGCDANQEAVVSSVGDFLAREAPLAANVRGDQLGCGFSPDLFRQMATLGFFGLATPTSLGGLGLGLFEVGLVASGLGFELVTGPWLETLAAVQLLGRTVGAEHLASRIVAGVELVSMPLRRVDWTSGATASLKASGRLSLTGAITSLGFAEGVDSWIVPARSADSRTILLAKLPAARNRVPLISVDPLWRGIALHLNSEPAEFVADFPFDRCEEVWDDVASLLAMNAMGGARRLLTLSVSYLKERRQFGQPIGGFQAMKHLVSNVFIDLAHSQNLAATACSCPVEEDRHMAVALAKIAADRSYLGAGEAALQTHGGIGFTWDVPVHFFLKAAMRQRLLPITTSEYSAAIRQRLGIE